MSNNATSSAIWEKEKWIKEILAKSGTNISEVEPRPETSPTRKDIHTQPVKMVYYTDMQSMLPTEHVVQKHNTHHQFQTQQQQHLQQQQHIKAEGPIIQMVSASSVSPTMVSNGTSNGYAINMHNMTGASQPAADVQLNTTKRLNGSPATKKGAAKPQFQCEQCNMMFGSKSAHTSHMKSHVKMELKHQQIAAMANGTGDAGMDGADSADSGMLSGGTVSSALSTSGSPTAATADPYQCDQCHKTFAVPARLVRHYRTHTGERPFECEFCHKMFSVKENLQVHRRIHTKERPYKCDVCGRAFEHSGKLHRHMRIHTGERPHKCSVCGKTFIQSGQLVIHMRTHTGEKPYRCPVDGCGKGFTCSKQLKVHSRTHTGEKPYHCDICFRDFGYNHVLKLHRVQHYGAKCYKCTICDETFKNKKEMEAHIKGHARQDDDSASSSSAPVNSPNMADDEPMPAMAMGTPAKKRVESGSGSGTPLLANGGGRRVSDNDSNESLASSGSSAASSGADSTNNTPMTFYSRNQPADAYAQNAVDHSMEATDYEQSQVNNALADAEDLAYYQMYPRFDGHSNKTSFGNNGSIVYSYGSGNRSGGVNPALLAAVSMAASAVEQEAAAEAEAAAAANQKAANMKYALSMSNGLPNNYTVDGVNGSNGTFQQHGHHEQVQSSVSQHQQYPSPSSYDQMPHARQQIFYVPVPKTDNIRSTINTAANNEIIKRVEAALVGSGNVGESLLTPPRSSVGSPERSLSPDEAAVILANRSSDACLPLRKRRVYHVPDTDHTSRIVPETHNRMHNKYALHSTVSVGQHQHHQQQLIQQDNGSAMEMSVRQTRHGKSTSS